MALVGVVTVPVAYNILLLAPVPSVGVLPESVTLVNPHVAAPV